MVKKSKGTTAKQREITLTHRWELEQVVNHSRAIANDEAAKKHIINNAIQVYFDVLDETSDVKLALKDSITRACVMAFMACQQADNDIITA